MSCSEPRMSWVHGDRQKNILPYRIQCRFSLVWNEKWKGGAPVSFAAEELQDAWWWYSDRNQRLDFNFAPKKGLLLKSWDRVVYMWIVSEKTCGSIIVSRFVWFSHGRFRVSFFSAWWLWYSVCNLGSFLSSKHAGKARPSRRETAS